MSKKYGNPWTTYNIPLNNDENDVFRIGCVHLHHFLHGKSAEYKPLMLKMHLEFVDSPSMTEAEGKNIEQQLEKNNSLVHERINALLSSFDNATRQAAQQLEVKVKTLEDALLVKDDVLNQLMERMKKLETNLSNSVANNCTTQDHSIEKPKQPSGSSQSNQQSYGCTIWNIKLNPKYDHIDNVIKLAERIGLSLNRDEINDINAYEPFQGSGSLNYFVCFCNKDLKDKFLKKSPILKEFAETKDLNISEETEYHTVVIRNITGFTSIKSAIFDVTYIANQMFLWLRRDQIKHVDVFKSPKNSAYYVYCVYFSTKLVKDTFLEKCHILKESEVTKHLQFY